MWVEDAGQPLCACMAGGKHAEGSRNRGVLCSLECATFRGLWLMRVEKCCKSYWPFYPFFFFFYKASNRSMEGMAICHHLLLFIFIFDSSVSGVGNYCSFSHELVFLNTVHWGTNTVLQVKWRHMSNCVHSILLLNLSGNKDDLLHCLAGVSVHSWLDLQLLKYMHLKFW